jgi:mannosyl-3-phosphoglycerate phosphatase
MKPAGGLIIYTDLDGTLLDHCTYSIRESLPALRVAATQGVPVVFCSSKTRAEIEVVQQWAGVKGPFIVEHGGAIYIPEGYFPFAIEESLPRDNFAVIELGRPYDKVVAALRRIRIGVPGCILGFSDLTDEEVASDCGLAPDEARRARRREYDEPFTILSADAGVMDLILERIERAGLRYTLGGRYHHLHGDHDKGRAVKTLNGLFQKMLGPVLTLGLGDNLNDLPMLEAVDLPVLVGKSDGSYDQEVIERLPHVRLGEGIGPQGWKTEVIKILAQAGEG